MEPYVPKMLFTEMNNKKEKQPGNSPETAFKTDLTQTGSAWYLPAEGLLHLYNLEVSLK